MRMLKKKKTKKSIKTD